MTQKQQQQSAHQPLRIGMVVGEVSGDTLGVKLMQAFQAQGIAVEFEGIGGPQMIAAGFHSLYPMETLSVMGIVEVLKEIRSLFAVRDGLVQRWTERPVDIFIGIDAPDFNLRLSQKIKAYALPIKTVQYVSPSVWAWRQKRVFNIKRNIDLVLCLFPFEVDFYHQYQVPAYFVGHPLAQQLPLQDQRNVACKQLALDEQQSYVALLPGSRGGEVQRLLPILLASAEQLLQTSPQLKFLIPAINAKRAEQIQQLLATQSQQLQQAVQVIENTSQEANVGRLVMEASQAVALASGTATLEAMLLHRPMVVVYQLHPLTYWIVKRMIKIPHYALPNIIAGRGYVQELIQKQATPHHVAAELQRLLFSPAGEQQQATHFQLHQQLKSENTMNLVEVILSLVK
ncbi:MAG: lipid-A-disaccharide synthase [Acinetobacter sp.]|nr:lipid-A-disaccharide synthase [Acinetobacter sp.]